MSRLLVAFSVLSWLVTAQGVGSRWTADPPLASTFLPPLDQGSSRLVAAAAPAEVRASSLEIGLDTGLTFEALLRERGGGSFRIEGVARPAAADKGGSRVRVRVTGSSLQVTIEGTRVKPRGGWRMGGVSEGRLLLYAGGGLVRIEKPRSEAWLGAATRLSGVR